MEMRLNMGRESRRRRLIEEITGGETRKDILPNSAFAFESERQAAYFSRARANMKSDMAHATMRHGNRPDDLRILEVIGHARIRRDK